MKILVNTKNVGTMKIIVGQDLCLANDNGMEVVEGSHASSAI